MDTLNVAVFMQSGLTLMVDLQKHPRCNPCVGEKHELQTRSVCLHYAGNNNLKIHNGWVHCAADNNLQIRNAFVRVAVSLSLKTHSNCVIDG